jgi:hypothetical protein
MDPSINGPTTKPRTVNDTLLRAFARQLWDHYQARVYLFGSRAKGTEQAQSDYDLVAVAASFADTSRFRRCLNRDSLWLDAGGWRKPLDLHCYTPEEFRRQKVGLGYLGDAHRHGELLRISPASFTTLDP